MGREIEFQGIQNARDLGGLRAKDGRVIAPGLLIRSANLSEATDADIRVLWKKYQVSKVIDLRTETERREKPDVLLEGVEYTSIPVFNESVAGISHEEGQSLSSVPDMAKLYSVMVTDESCRENLGKAARCVMEHDFSQGSVLWHCTEGKDRCGLLTMILLSTLEVDRATILDDYLMTNAVNAPKAEKYYQMLLSAGKSEKKADAVRNVFLAKTEYLDKAFATIDAHYMDMKAFLYDGLNIPAKAVKTFQNRLFRMPDPQMNRW